MPACSTVRSASYRGRRTRQLQKIQSSWVLWPRRECSRSGSIGGKTHKLIESPRSRLVTWSYADLNFLGRRFWRPHPDLDRSATPALPPGGGRPFAGVGLGCSLAGASASPWSRKDAGRGQRARITYRRLSRWVLRGQKHVGGLRAHVGWRGGWGGRIRSADEQGFQQHECAVLGQRFVTRPALG